MTDKPLILIGASANILTYKETAERLGIPIVGIIEDDYYTNTDNIKGIPVIGTEKNLDSFDSSSYNFFIATNWSPHDSHQRDKTKRNNFIRLAADNNLSLINLIDPSASVSKYAKLGCGIFVGANAIIESECSIDNYAQIFYNVSIAYGSSIGENASIQNSSLIVAHIGKNAFVGMATKVFPYFASDYIEIGDNAVIYPNLSVHTNLDTNVVVTG